MAAQPLSFLATMVAQLIGRIQPWLFQLTSFSGGLIEFVTLSSDGVVGMAVFGPAIIELASSSGSTIEVALCCDGII